MSEKKKTVILVSYLIFLCAACISLIFIRESASFSAQKSIAELNLRIDSLEAGSRELFDFVADIQSGADADTPASSQKKYVIREHNGKVAIFSSSGALLRELDFYVKALPEADRERVRRGVEVGSLSELYSLIRDYIS